MTVLLRPNPSSGVPIYLQLMEQVKHNIETGALRPGEQLPGIRPLAEELVINPNTVAKAYRELEHEGIIELRHGAGAFVSANAGAKNADRQTARRAGHRRGGDGAAARARRHRRGDPAVVRGGAGGAPVRSECRNQEVIVTDPFVIETVELKKDYDGVEAVRGLNLQVPAGSIFGFLGSNGAGKTSTIKILLGMARPTNGQRVSSGCRPTRRPRASTFGAGRASSSEDKELTTTWTWSEMIRFTADFYPRWRARPAAALPPRVRAARSIGRSNRSREACAPSWRCCWRSAVAPNC